MEQLLFAQPGYERNCTGRWVTSQPSPQFPFGGKVDSLNGIAGHLFGQPLSAFPQMRAIPASPGELTRAYVYEGSEGWFGKHHQQIRTQFYYFLNGKFCRFIALGDPTVLRPEATYLFGPGQAEGKYRLFREGSRARAAYSEQASGIGMEGQLMCSARPSKSSRWPRRKPNSRRRTPSSSRS